MLFRFRPSCGTMPYARRQMVAGSSVEMRYEYSDRMSGSYTTNSKARLGSFPVRAGGQNRRMTFNVSDSEYASENPHPPIAGPFGTCPRGKRAGSDTVDYAT